MFIRLNILRRDLNYILSNKHDIKLRCIDIIIDYFNLDKMQFRQPIYTNDIEYELMGIDGIRAVNFVQLTQNFFDDIRK